MPLDLSLMTRTSTILPHSLKCIQRASSSTLNGRFPTKMPLLRSFLTAKLEADDAISVGGALNSVTVMCCSANSLPVRLRESTADWAFSKRTKAEMDFRSGWNSCIMTATFLGIAGSATAAHRSHTD